MRGQRSTDVAEAFGSACYDGVCNAVCRLKTDMDEAAPLASDII